MLARPDRRLTNIDPWILANPRSQDIEIVTSLKWDLLASLFVKQVAPLVTKVAIESRVCTSTDRQQWFVHVSNLENDALALVRPNGHHLAASFPQIRNLCAIGDIILDSLTGQSVRQCADARRRIRNGA